MFGRVQLRARFSQRAYNRSHGGDGAVGAQSDAGRREEEGRLGESLLHLIY
jgi:hypothetical protein